jgi:hypothetical protein
LRPAGWKAGDKLVDELVSFEGFDLALEKAICPSRPGDQIGRRFVADPLFTDIIPDGVLSERLLRALV